MTERITRHNIYMIFEPELAKSINNFCLMYVNDVKMVPQDREHTNNLGIRHSQFAPLKGFSLDETISLLETRMSCSQRGGVVSMLRKNKDFVIEEFFKFRKKGKDEEEEKQN